MGCVSYFLQLGRIGNRFQRFVWVLVWYFFTSMAIIICLIYISAKHKKSRLLGAKSSITAESEVNLGLLVGHTVCSAGNLKV